MNKVRIIIIAASLCLFYFQINSQPSLLWEKRYSGSGTFTDIGKLIEKDKSGNIVVVGQTFENYDVIIIKYDNSGVELWRRIFTSAGNSRIVGLSIDQGNNILLAAVTPNSSFDEVAAIKYSPSGSIIWDKRYRYSDAGEDRFGVTCSDSSDNVYICGSSKSTSGSYGLVTLKYNTAGVLQFESFVQTGNIPLTVDKLLRDNSGNLYACGMVESTSGNSNAFLAKLGPAGSLEFFQQYNYTAVSGVDRFTDIAVNSLGTEIYTAGLSWGGTASREDFITARYSNSGMISWIQRYNGPGSSVDMAGDIEIDASGNVFAGGISNGGATGDDFAIAKYSSAGTPLGYQRFTVGSSAELYASMIMDQQKQNLYLIGTSSSDLMIIKYGTNLNMQWYRSYNSQYNLYDGGYSMKVDSTSVYAVGFSQTPGTSLDMITLKFGNLVSVNQEGVLIPSVFTLHQNYPNPFNPNTVISFDIPANGNVSLEIFDAAGRLVSTPVNHYLEAGSYEFNFVASGLSSGIYFYVLNAGNFTDTKKMVLIK